MKKLMIGLGLLGMVLVGVFFGVGAVLPEDYEVERSIEISATPAKIYALVGNLERWPEWSTWNSEKYPDLQYTYPGQTEGTGAISEWTMEDGTGRLEIISAEESGGIVYNLSFDDGTFESEGVIAFATAGEMTTVTWKNSGALKGTMNRWFGLFLDTMMGGDFEKGLSGLKEKAEAPG